MGPTLYLSYKAHKVYKLNFLISMKIYNVFHVSLLKSYNGQDEDNASLPLSIVIDDEEKYEVKKILDSKLHYRKLQYLIKWIGYPYFKNTWLAKNNLEGFIDFIEIFHKAYPTKPNIATSAKQKEVRHDPHQTKRQQRS